jgi:quinoprotein glucose dehydrogenase
MLYVRSADQPAMHILREYRPGDSESGTPEQRGRAVYAERCEMCHGLPEAGTIKSMDRASVIGLKEIGPDRIRTVVRQGRGQMPAFPESVISARQLDALMAYLANPPLGAAKPRRGPPPPAPIPGLTRYTGPLGSMLRANNGLSAISPPWAQITAYDLNTGTIKWQTPLGTVPELAAKGIRDTGNNHRVHRNGPIVTAGGLIFVGTWADRSVRAFDKQTGAVLWEKQIDANPEGVAATYQVRGRQYVAFCASGAEAGTPNKSIAFVQGKAEAQGYYVFALPQRREVTARLPRSASR